MQIHIPHTQTIEAESPLHQYADMLAEHCSNPIARLVRDLGRYWGPGEKLPIPIDCELFSRPQACWENATLIALAYPDRYIYCEGWAISSAKLPIPLDHGWIMDVETGRVIDTTWRYPDSQYYGIPFKAAFRKKHTREGDPWGLLDWMRQGMILNHSPEEFLYEKE